MDCQMRTQDTVRDVLFQPIFEIAGDEIRMYGLECLSSGRRGSASDRIETALRRASALPQSLQIHINVASSTIADDAGFVDMLTWVARANEIEMNRIVVEIVEDGHVWNELGFRATIDALRAQGVSIALDEIGGERSSIPMILDCRPDYFKLDGRLVSGIHKDGGRQAMVRSISVIASRIGARVIAEGVEAGPDLETLRGLRVSLIQGCLLARPREAAVVS
jgi:EAL domain-containing protein (putative c-di-GMP-specific phosphodiesterase class I)